ncbi:MAG: ATP synthase F1 subunit delta [Myxococcota bacterium]
MRASAAAKRYARALFSLATEAGEVDRVRGELDTGSELFAESAELREALLTPLRPAAERKQVLSAVSDRLGFSDLMHRFFSFVIDQRRLLDFAAIREEYIRLADEKAGVTTASIVSAVPLDAGAQERLSSALSRRTGKRVQLEIAVDPELLGGIVAKVGDLVFDGSLRTQLGQLRANLTKESSR